MKPNIVASIKEYVKDQAYLTPQRIKYEKQLGKKIIQNKAKAMIGKQTSGVMGKALTVGNIAMGVGIAALIGIGAYSSHKRSERQRNAARINPGYKRAYGMPVDGGINATGDLTLALRGARHR